MNTLLAIWLAAHSCDTVTTHLALSRGGVEQNPLLTQSAVTNDLIMTGEAAVMGVALRKYAPKHPRMAAWLAIGGIAISSYAAVHNVQTLRIQGQRLQ